MGDNMKFATSLLILLLTGAAVAQVSGTNPVRQLVFRAGYDNGPALVNLQLQHQKRLFGLGASGTVQYVIWQCDAGASSLQLAYRRAGNAFVITPLMVPASVGAVSGTVACASKDGNNKIWEGNAVPCSKMGTFSLSLGDTLETTDSPTADGVSASCSAFVMLQ
jgi:hypothetical protein